METSKSFAWVIRCWLILALIGCSPEASGEHGPSIGVLLDYTGTEAAGFSEEQALLLAADLMADAREGAPPFRFVYRDASGSPERARQVAHELVAEGVDVVIGPSSDEVAPMVRDVLAEADVTLVSPNPTVGQDATSERPWFRLSPGNLTGSTTPALIGEHMAREFARRGGRRALIVSDDDVYNSELVRGFTEGLANRDGQVSATLRAADSQTRQTIATLHESGADGVLVATSILHAAHLVWGAYSSSEGSPKWLLTPRLKSELLLINVPQGALEGAYGVSLRIPHRLSACDAAGSTCFRGAMRHAWGAEAFESAYFMYDAAAIVLIAADRVWRQNGGAIDQTLLREAIFETADRGGIRLDWRDFPLAVERASDGRDVQYSGVTGSVVFTPSGSRVGGETLVFEVRDHTFVDVIE